MVYTCLIDSASMLDLKARGKDILVYKDGQIIGGCILVDTEKRLAYKMNTRHEVQLVEGVDIQIVSERPLEKFDESTKPGKF